MNFNQFVMANSIVKGLEALYDLFTLVLLGVLSTRRNYTSFTYNMIMQN